MSDFFRWQWERVTAEREARQTDEPAPTRAYDDALCDRRRRA